MRYIFARILCLFCALLLMSAGAGFAQGTVRQIEIRHANTTEFAEAISPNAYRLIGEVEFFHDGVLMRCDSAWWYKGDNMMDAYGSVYITKVEGTDNVVITSDRLQYRGNEKIAELWGHVVLDDQLATLRTDRLYYNLETNICYYLSWAEIENKGSTMTSEQGYYHRNINQFYFKRKVELLSADYKIFTDTLQYNSKSTLADFVGPTRIITLPASDSIYCERGWYNTQDTVALFRRNSWLKSGTSKVFADSLYFDKIQGIGKAHGHVRIIDEKNPAIITGNFGFYNSIDQSSYVTGRAQLILTGEKDSLFLHADTLRSDLVSVLPAPEEILPVPEADTLIQNVQLPPSPATTLKNGTDTLQYKLIRGFPNVRFYSIDMQGKCDSIAYSTQDSVIRMFIDPVLWGQNNQMSSERIELLFYNQKIHQLNLLRAAFIISKEDSLGYNQLKGRNISGFFRGEQELFKIESYDGSNFVYFVKDQDEYTGINIGASSNVIIWLKDQDFDKFTFIGDPSGILYPMEQLPPMTERLLTGFSWLEKFRPLNKEDIFRKVVSDTPRQVDATQSGEDAGDLPDATKADE